MKAINPGLTYYRSKDLNDCDEEVAPLGSEIVGTVEGRWLKVGEKFLPLQLDGVQIFEPNATMEATETGLAFYRSKDLNDRDGEIAPWGSQIVGIVEGRGLKVGDKILPIELDNVQMTEPSAPPPSPCPSEPSPLFPCATPRGSSSSRTFSRASLSPRTSPRSSYDDFSGRPRFAIFKHPSQSARPSPRATLSPRRILSTARSPSLSSRSSSTSSVSWSTLFFPSRGASSGRGSRSSSSRTSSYSYSYSSLASSRSASSDDAEHGGKGKGKSSKGKGKYIKGNWKGPIAGQAFMAGVPTMKALTSGLSWRSSRNLNDKDGSVVPWGSGVVGVPENGWLRVRNKFLPMQVNGVQIMLSQRFVVGNAAMKAINPGLAYYRSKDWKDRDEEVAPWGSVVVGTLEGPWLKVGEKFLPIVLNGMQIIVAQSILTNDAEVQVESFPNCSEPKDTIVPPSNVSLPNGEDVCLEPEDTVVAPSNASLQNNQDIRGEPEGQAVAPHECSGQSDVVLALEHARVLVAHALKHARVDGHSRERQGDQSLEHSSVRVSADQHGVAHALLHARADESSERRAIQRKHLEPRGKARARAERVNTAGSCGSPPSPPRGSAFSPMPCSELPVQTLVFRKGAGPSGPR